MASAFADNPARRAALFGAVLALSACSSDRTAQDTKDGSAEHVDAATRDATHVPPAPEAEAAAPVTVTPAQEGEPYQTLSEWHLFRDAARQTPADGVVPYEVI